CITAIGERFSAAKSPAILVDADAGRFGVASDLRALAEKMQAPVAVLNTAKSVIDETFPHYLGIYSGKASEPHTREAIETSDCLLAIGYRPLEVTTGDFSASLPANTIHARGHSVDVGNDNYQAVTLKEVIKGVIGAVPRAKARPPYHLAPWLTRAFLPAMRARNSGHIVNISSVGSRFVWPGATAYIAARWAIRGLTQALRADLHGCRVGVTLYESAEIESPYWARNPGSLER